MKILTVGPYGSFGGLETHFKLLNSFLFDEGHSVLQCLVKTSGHGKIIDSCQLSSRHILLSSASGFQGKIKAIHELSKLYYKVKAFKPDLIIASAIGFRYVVIAALAPKHVFKLHQEVIGDIPHNHLLRSLMSLAYGNTACQSESLLKSVRSAVKPLPNLSILPCFSNPIGERFPYRAKLPSLDEPIRFSYFGRLAANKGLLEMVRAFCSAGCYENSELHIHGMGPMFDQIIALKNSIDLKGQITMCGNYSNDEELALKMSHMHALLIVSQYNEGLPLIILEAMSVGLPFLATNICGLPDAAKDNPDSLLCRPDEISIREGIDSMFTGLATGQFHNDRLCDFYDKRFHSSLAKQQWRICLNHPDRFFVSQSST